MTFVWNCDAVAAHELGKFDFQGIIEFMHHYILGCEALSCSRLICWHLRVGN